MGRVFWTFDRSLVVEGSLGAPKVTVWAPGSDFFVIFSGFGEPVVSRCLASVLFFIGSRLSILRVSSEVCFLVGLGQKMMPGSVVGCAENIINTVVFVRFHFFTYSVNWMISNRLLNVFLVAFWVPWAHFF